MGTKRARGQETPVSRPKSKKVKKKMKKSGNGTIISVENKFDALPSDEASDSDVLYDYDNKHSDLVLLDSDESDIVVQSDGDNADQDEDEGPVSKKPKIENELAKNADFIEFGFSSSEEDGDGGEFSDDGVLSVDEDGKTHIRSNASSAFPWVKNHDHSRQKEIADWLTMEMKDFVNYISPSSSEIHTRNKVVNTLKDKISAFWPGTETHVFGSSATDLYLPGSDIDMVVVSKTGDYEERSKLYQLSSFLRNNKLAKNIEVIAKAKVPIIKFVDPATLIDIDISFERTNGIDAAKRIRRWMDSTPGLRELILIVKQFLRSRKLNNVHVGGLGGYSTIIMCYHFLKLHPKVSTSSMSALDNLGALLIEFFELYGRNFSYDNLIISFEPDSELPRYLPKSQYRALNTSKNPFSIIIQDPADPSNNITRSSYNLRDIKKAFGGAYQLLTDKCYALNSSSYKERLGALILGDIIKYRGKERDFNDDRHKVVNHALVNHADEEQDDESDGLEGNDKYYYSDMTVESEDEFKVDTTDKPDSTIKKPTKSTNPSGSGGKVQTPEEAKASKKAVSDILGIDSEDEDTVEEIKEQQERKALLDKGIKRDYWKQKGLEL